MGWKDRAVEDPSAPKKTGGWRNRAEEDLSAQKMTLVNGDETAEIDATPEALHEAEARGFNTPEAQANLSKYKPREPYSPLNSAAQSAVASATMGFDDEAHGAIKGVKALMAGKGLQGAHRDYVTNRDGYRAEKEAAARDNPVSSFFGGLAGGAIVPGFAAANSARLGGAVWAGASAGLKAGAVQGLGDSKDITDVGDTAGNIAFGAGSGALTGGLVGGGIHSFKNPRQLKEAVTETIPGYLRAAVSGAKEAGKDVEGTGAVGQAIAMPGGAIKGLFDQRRQNKNFQELVDKSKDAGEAIIAGAGPRAPRAPIDVDFDKDRYPEIKIGEPPTRAQERRRTPVIGKEMTDKEYALRMMWERGPSKIKRNYADQGATQFPGQLDADRYNDLLEMGTTGRETAREFNRDAHGADLVPQFEKTRKIFEDTRSQRWNELHGEASKNYQGNDEILMHIGDALEDATSTPVTQQITGVLTHIQNMVAAGKGTKRAGLKPGTWDDVDGVERFNRLQQARKQLYDQGVYAKSQGLTEAEHIIKDLTAKIDRELKISPAKVEADGMWSKSKRLEESFFDPAEFKDGSVDKYKIGNMLKATESAKRFRDNISRFQEFINDPGFNPKMKEAGQKLIDDFSAASSLAEQQRALSDFRWKQGPTSPAIERQTAIMGGKTSPLTEAIQAPSGFMSSTDQFTKVGSRRYFGKTFQQLTDSEKDTLVKMKFWENKNKGFSDDQAFEYFNKIKKNDNPTPRPPTGRPLDELSPEDAGKINGGAMDNNAPRRKMKLPVPYGRLMTQRNVNHAGQSLRHEVYKDGGEIVHSLVDENGNRMAEIRGNMKKYNGQEGFAVKKSSSSEGSQGHGKKLYDLALDTHGKVFSDTSLSPEGARPVYEKHFPNQPGVEVTPDTRGKKDRFQVDLKDREGFRQKGGIEGFDAKGEGDVKKLNKVTLRNRLGFDSGSPESESSYYGNWDDGPSKKPTEALEELTPEETGKVTGGVLAGSTTRNIGKPQKPFGDVVMERDVNHNGRTLKHKVYKDKSTITHTLFDEKGEQLAQVRGHMNTVNNKEGFTVEWAHAGEKGQGYGRKAYDLALDTHGTIHSDIQLSPEGSAKVYEEHFKNSPDVETKLAPWKTKERHMVDLKNRDGFRQSKGISGFDPKHDSMLEDVNEVTSYGFPGPRATHPSSPRPEPEDWRYQNRPMTPSKAEIEASRNSIFSADEWRKINEAMAAKAKAKANPAPRTIVQDIEESAKDGYREHEIFNSLRGRDGMRDLELIDLIKRTVKGRR